MERAAQEKSGYAWQLAENASPSVLAPVLDRFPDLGGLPGASLLKENHFRSVYRLAEQGVIAKVYRYTSRRDRLLYRLLLPRAEKEWRALGRLRALGLPAPSPLAVARLERGGSVLGGGLVIELLKETEPLGERLRLLLGAAAPGAGDGAGSEPEPVAAAALAGPARDLLLRVAELVRRLHDAGVWHRDLHAGNLLYSRPDGKVHFIDLHSCTFQGRLARWQRRGGVAKLAHSLAGVVPREGLRLFLEAYGPERLFAGGAARAEEGLRRAVERIERRRLRSRSRRCFVRSTRFTVEKRRGLRLYRLRELPAAGIEELWQREPAAAPIQRSAAGWVSAWVTRGGARVCVKYRTLSLLESLQAVFESHRLRRAYAAGHALWVRHIPTPQVLALRERTVLGLVREAHLVTELVDGGVPLDRFLFDEYWGKPPPRGPAARRRRLLAREAGRFVRRLHDAGLYPHDLSPKNLLVSPGALRGEGGEDGGGASDGERAGLQLVDLDHLYLWQPLTDRGRRRNLIQLANLPEGHIGVTDRLRALAAYAGGGAKAGSRFWTRPWIAALRAGVLREHARVLAGRIARERSCARS